MIGNKDSIRNSTKVFLNFKVQTYNLESLQVSKVKLVENEGNSLTSLTLRNCRGQVQQYNMQLPGALLGLSSLNFFLKNLFRKSFFYFVKKAFLIFRKRKLSYFFLKKVFVIFRESYIQNPIIFRTLPNIYDGTFCKNSYLSHFSAWTCLKSKAQLIEVTEQQNMTNKNDLSNLQTR